MIFGDFFVYWLVYGPVSAIEWLLTMLNNLCCFFTDADVKYENTCHSTMIGPDYIPILTGAYILTMLTNKCLSTSAFLLSFPGCYLGINVYKKYGNVVLCY